MQHSHTNKYGYGVLSEMERDVALTLLTFSFSSQYLVYFLPAESLHTPIKSQTASEKQSLFCFSIIHASALSVHVEPCITRACFSSRAPLVREWFTINKTFYLGVCHSLHPPRLTLLWSCSRILWKNVVNSLEVCGVTEGKHNILMCQAKRVQHDMLRERYGKGRGGGLETADFLRKHW